MRFLQCRLSSPHLRNTTTMPSSPSRGSGLLFFSLAMVACLFTVVLSADSEWTWFDCQSSSTAASSSTNSTFWSNVVALLDALPSAAAPTGFASLSHGNGTDRAFVRGICRGDSTAAQCTTYLRNAALSIRSHCNSTRRAAIWYDDGSTVTYPAPMFCFVSYADTNASTAHEDAYWQEFQNSFVVSNTAVLETAYSTLMSSLAARVVVNGSGTGTPPSPAPMFATGAAVYDPTAPNGTMYGLLQCMRDRTAAECAKCLNESVQQLPSCCRGHRGGIVMGYNCYLRMEVYPYYDLALDGPPLVLAPAPAPAPSTFSGESRPGKKTFGATLPIALAVGTVLAAVLVVVAIFLCRRNKAKQKQNPQVACSSRQQAGARRLTEAELHRHAAVDCLDWRGHLSRAAGDNAVEPKHGNKQDWRGGPEGARRRVVDADSRRLALGSVGDRRGPRAVLGEGQARPRGKVGVRRQSQLASR